jgi:cobaltochelatase CobN
LSADQPENPSRLTTRVRSPAQLLLCKGCCCGRTDRGLPEVPVERIKAAWKAEKLNRGVQLTISGCLGPCDLPNVAVLVTATARPTTTP